MTWQMSQIYKPEIVGNELVGWYRFESDIILHHDSIKEVFKIALTDPKNRKLAMKALDAMANEHLDQKNDKAKIDEIEFLEGFNGAASLM